MALDVSIPMQGQQIDTASPLMNLVEMTRQNRMDNAQLAGSAIDLQNKKNMLTMQTLSAGAAGGQQSYDTAKQLLQKNGIDTSGWAPDYQTGQVQAKALQTALIPPVAMMNADIQRDRNNITRNENAGLAPPAAPNANAPIQSNAGPTVTQILDTPQPQGAHPAGTPPALPMQPQAQQPQQTQNDPQGIQQVQQHYQDASPEDQKTAQNIVNGAVQLQGMQGNPQSVQKFLDDPNNMHDQHNIDMRKLWMSDTTPDKQKFWQQNAIDVKTGQAMGIAPAQQQSQPTFTPPAYDPSKSAAFNKQMSDQALATFNANNKASLEGADTEAKNAADYKKSLLDKVSENEGAIRIINAQEKMLKSFTPGALTTNRAAMANFATTLGMPDSIVRGIAGGDAGAIEAFQGLSSQHALLQLKSLVDGGKINRTEYQGFKEDLANPNKLEGAIYAINQIQKDNYTAQIKELGAMTDWEKSGKPLSQFRQNYAQTVSGELMGSQPSGDQTPTFSDPSDPAFKALPAGARFVDKDTGKTMVKH